MSSFGFRVEYLLRTLAVGRLLDLIVFHFQGGHRAPLQKNAPAELHVQFQGRSGRPEVSVSDPNVRHVGLEEPPSSPP